MKKALRVWERAPGGVSACLRADRLRRILTSPIPLKRRVQKMPKKQQTDTNKRSHPLLHHQSLFPEFFQIFTSNLLILKNYFQSEIAGYFTAVQADADSHWRC